jgi:hypothetical protein
MAHSHQQTLLAKLGFSDPDHKDPRHTLACEYLCKPEVARKVIQVVDPLSDSETACPDPVKSSQIMGDAITGGQGWIGRWVSNTEQPVMNKAYYIGFLDVVITYAANEWVAQWEHNTACPFQKGRFNYQVLVEVKVSRCDPADIVKQLKLYDQYCERGRSPRTPVRLVVATCYPVSQSTKDMFAREGIRHIFLGAGFEAYCAARRAEKPVTEEGL